MKRKSVMKKSFNFNFSNRLAYTLIVFLVLAIISVGVYAVAGTTPNPGHSLSELQPCSAGETLKMVGTSWTCGSDSDSQQLSISGNTLSIVATGGSNSVTLPSSTSSGGQWTTSGTNIYNSNTGKVGIGTGTTAPTEKLQVTGNALISGSVTAAQFYYSSDKNLKENIKSLSNSLEKIQQLQGVSFNWKESGEPNIGLIAQDVEKIYPELVSTGIDGNKAVQYGNLVAPLIESVKQQQKQINELKYEIEALKLMCNQ